MSDLEIELIPILSDNYAYFLVDRPSGTVGIVDPGTAGPIAQRITAGGGRLDWILITHHHCDHTGGIAELKALTGARVAGPAAEAARIPSLDVRLAPEEDFAFGQYPMRIIPTPGHTLGHISLHFPEAGALFCGDTLFVMGCGRLSEGDAAMMHSSLGRLAALPDDTRVFCGHEYTLNNARFAATVDGTNQQLTARLGEVERLREASRPTIPSTIGEEKATNPFLRAADPAIRQTLGLGRATEVEVFAELRRRKDRF